MIKERKWSIVNGALMVMITGLGAGLLGDSFDGPERIFIAFTTGVALGVVAGLVWLLLYGKWWDL